MKLEISYKLFKNGNCSMGHLKNCILEYAYKQVSRDKYIEAGDFILVFIKKVESIINNYNSDLAGFNHYINRHIKWLMFSFNRSYIEDKEKRDAYNSHYIAEYKEQYKKESHNPDYTISANALRILSVENGVIKKQSQRKRLEIFVLKNSRNLTSAQIELLAPLLKRSKEWIYSHKESLDKKCEERIYNREYLKQRFNRLFIEITRDQHKLTIMKDGREKDLLFNKMIDKQRRKNELNEMLKKRNCGPKNEEVAIALGIPKGTVDSSLFYMKKALESLLQENNID
jgi:hypothetical protein